MKGINPPTNDFAWPTLDCNASHIIRFAELTDHIRYKLGAKNPFTRPLKDIKLADCSDWFRRMVFQLAELTIPDGTFMQMDWARRMGFKRSTMDACKLKDGALRMVVRAQRPGDKGVSRHVWACYMGKAYHCSSTGGGVAVTRLLPSTGRETVWVLTAPQK